MSFGSGWIAGFERTFLGAMDGRNILQVRRRRFTLGFGLAEVLAFSITAVALVGRPPMLPLGAAAFAVAAAILVFLLRYGPRPLLAQAFILVTLAWFAFLTAFDITSFGALFALFAPMVAVALSGMRSATAWTAVVAIVFSGLSAAVRFDPSLADRLPASLVPFIGGPLLGELAALAAFLGFGLFYEGTMRRSLAELDRAESETRDGANRLDALLTMQNALIETLPIPVYIKDLDRRFIGCNKAFADSLGRAKGDIMGKRTEDFSRPDLAELYGRTDDQLLATLEPLHFTGDVAAADGRVLPTEQYKAVYRGLDGRPAGIVGAFVDVSERKAAEERMRGLLGARDRILAIISHDLLNPVWGLKQTLELEPRPLSPETSELFMTEFERSVGRLYHLLENVLGWARLQWHEARPERALFDASAMVRDEAVSLGRTAAGVAILTELEGSVQVCSDQNMVRILVRNLVSNAVKNSPAGTTVQVSLAREDGHIRIAIRDAGPGMPQPVLDELESGSPVLESGHRGGHGFGLPLCRDFAAILGTRLEFDTAPGRGTVASFRLPVGAACVDHTGSV